MAAVVSSTVVALPLPASLARCGHCGDPCATGAVVTDTHVFCCVGCQSVFEILRDHDLAAFYICDPAAGLSQRTGQAPSADAFASLDLPEVAEGFLTPGGDRIRRATFPVPNLHCAACVWLLEQLWKLDPAVRRSEVDLVQRVVRVDFDTHKTSLRRIAELLARVGYAPSLDVSGQAGGAPSARRRLYVQLGLAGFAFGNAMIFSIPRYVNGAPLDPLFQGWFNALNVALALPVFFVSASDYWRGAWAALRARTVTLDVPIALGLLVLFARSLADIVAGAGEGYLDSFTGLVFFLLIGRLFQMKAFEHLTFDRTMAAFLPLSVLTERDGERRATPVGDIRAGDILHVRPREVVPTDAVLLSASGTLEYAFVTGEQTPILIRAGQHVRAGGRVIGGTLRLAALSQPSESRLAAMFSGLGGTHRPEHWLVSVSARFGQGFTVAAIGLAAAGALWWWPDTRMALNVATSVLIIACPCALTLSAPITLGTALGRLGRRGWFLRTPSVVLDLARIDTVVFDKTGTLATSGSTAAAPELDGAAWRLARRLATESLHPTSRAIAADFDPADLVALPVTHLDESPHGGIRGQVAGHVVAIGTAAYVGRGVGPEGTNGPLVTWARVDDRFGQVVVSPTMRPGVPALLTALRRGYRLWLTSGDHALEAPSWRPWFGERLRFLQSPVDKVSLVRDRQAEGRHVLVVGDGLNDAGALRSAHVGLAVSDDTACIVPSCDAIVGGRDLASLAGVLAYARRARRVIVLCFVVSLLYNAIGLSLALAGHLTPLATAVLMPVSSLTIVGLSTGLMRWRAGRGSRP